MSGPLANQHGLQVMSPSLTPLGTTSQIDYADDRMDTGGAMTSQSSTLARHNAGGDPTPPSPAKEVLYNEVDDLRARMQAMENEANHVINATRQDLTRRAEEALSHQNAQFQTVTQRFEQEARDVHRVELEQSLARERGQANASLTDASRRLRAEAQTISSLKLQNKRTETIAEKALAQERFRAETVIQETCGNVVSEARNALAVESKNSSLAQGDLLQECADLRHQLHQAELHAQKFPWAPHDRK